jgi:CHAD domain-containing protein
MHPGHLSKHWKMAEPRSIASSQNPDEAPVAMSSSPNPVSRVTLHAERRPQPRRRSIPRLNAEMACDTAFRVIARSCQEDLTANHAATCKGDDTALHEMRIALTRLRAAICFFSPMTVDASSDRLRRELKWLNTQLGAARDMDVAIERLKAPDRPQPRSKADQLYWKRKGMDSHRALTQALRSIRYRRLIKDLSAWIENGSWSTARDKHAEKQRACPIVRYSTRKLTRWHEKLLKQARGLEDMGAKRRHRLRLANKRLRYSIEFFAGLLSDKTSSMHTSLKHLRKAQQSLGELNDAVNGQALVAILQRNTQSRGDSSPFLDRKREGQLMRSATRAYRKMDELRPPYH